MIAFDDAGERVEAVEPEVYGDEIPVRDEAEADRHERLTRLLEWLLHAEDAAGVGRRCIVLGHLLHVPGAPRTVRDLGDAMGVSASKAHRLKHILRDFIEENRS